MKWLGMVAVGSVDALGLITEIARPWRRLSSLWIMSLVLMLTACGGGQDPDGEVPDRFRADGALGFGPVTEPWETLPEDRAPVVATDSDFGQQVQTLSPAEPRFSHKGVELALMPDFMQGPVEVSVSPVKLPPPRQGAQVNAYDFSLSTASSDLGVMEITIPYPDGESITGDTVIGAAYFNRDKGAWEPVAFEVDEENEQVVISTTHMSIYSCFSFTGEGTRYSRISGIFPIPSSVAGDDYDEVLVEAINNGMTPGKEALKLGVGVTSEALGFSGALLNLSALQSSLGYNTIFTENLSGILGNVGSAAALMQLATDYERGKKQTRLLGNAIKNVTNYMVSRFGSSLLNAAYVGVFAIDYSLNKLIQTTLEDRKSIWANAYRMYYEEEQSRTPRDWYQVLRRIQEDSRNPKEFKTRFEEELDEYVNLFWEEAASTIAGYQSRAQETGFTAFGGMGEGVRNDLSTEFRKVLLTGVLKPVFNRLEKEHRIRQQEQYGRSLEELSSQLNRRVVLTIKEEHEGESATYGGYYVRLGPLNERADPEQWTGRINPEGRLVATFTVLGHLQAGAPSELRLYPDRNALDRNDPELTVDFSVDVPQTEVTLEPGDSAGGRWRLVKAAEVENDAFAPNLERMGPDARVTRSSEGRFLSWGMPAEEMEIPRGPTYSFDVEAEKGKLRTLTAWEEPVHDAEGRRQEARVELRTTRRWSPPPPRSLEPGETLEMTEQLSMEAVPADLYARARHAPELTGLMATYIDRQRLGQAGYTSLEADQLRGDPIESMATYSWQVPTGKAGERIRIRLWAGDSAPAGLGQISGHYLDQFQWVNLLYVYEYEE